MTVRHEYTSGLVNFRAFKYVSYPSSSSTNHQFPRGRLCGLFTITFIYPGSRRSESGERMSDSNRYQKQGLPTIPTEQFHIER